MSTQPTPLIARQCRQDSELNQMAAKSAGHKTGEAPSGSPKQQVKVGAQEFSRKGYQLGRTWPPECLRFLKQLHISPGHAMPGVVEAQPFPG